MLPGYSFAIAPRRSRSILEKHLDGNVEDKTSDDNIDGEGWFDGQIFERIWLRVPRKEDGRLNRDNDGGTNETGRLSATLLSRVESKKAFRIS